MHTHVSFETSFLMFLFLEMTGQESRVAINHKMCVFVVFLFVRNVTIMLLNIRGFDFGY